MRETQVRSLGWKDPREKEMATHSSILAWKIPRMEELVGYSPWGCKESDTTERLHFHFTVAQFTRAKMWKLPKGPLTDESWINKMLHKLLIINGVSFGP